MQVSEHPYLRLNCRKSTAWAWGGVKLVVDLRRMCVVSDSNARKSQIAGKSDVSDIPGVRVGLAVGPGMKLEDRLRAVIRAKGYAYTTEET